MKTTQQKKKTLRNKCDRLMQELGRKAYKHCLVCGKPHQVLHHYYPKSTSAVLRYDWENLINLCNGCHFSLHNSNPAIQNTINEVKGQAWLDRLNIKRRQHHSDTLGYYQDIYEKLKKANELVV